MSAAHSVARLNRGRPIGIGILEVTVARQDVLEALRVSIGHELTPISTEETEERRGQFNRGWSA